MPFTRSGLTPYSRRQSKPPQNPIKSYHQECSKQVHMSSTAKDFAKQSVPPKQTTFSPTVNRFSILAALDANPAQWSFDFSQTQNSISSCRRRGKRGGKHVRTKGIRKQRKSEQREVADNLCEQMAEMCPQGVDAIIHDPDPQDDVPTQALQGDSATFPDNVRHPWIPQFGSAVSIMKDLTPCKDKESTLFGGNQSVDPFKQCLTMAEKPAFKRKESRFFPMAAFLASPDIASTQSPRLPLGTLSKVAEASKRLSDIINTEPNTPTVASECRALLSERTISPPLTISLSIGREQLQTLSQPVKKEESVVVKSSVATSPEISKDSVASWTSASLIDMRPMRSATAPTTSEYTVPDGRPGAAHPNNTHQLRKDPLENAALPSPTKPVRPLLQKALTLQTPFRPRSECGEIDEIAHSSNIDRHSRDEHADLEHFLSLGHADPCWCRRNILPTPPPSDTESYFMSNDCYGMTFSTSLETPAWPDMSPDQYASPNGANTPSLSSESEFEDLECWEPWKMNQEDWTILARSETPPPVRTPQLPHTPLAQMSPPSDESDQDGDTWTILPFSPETRTAYDDNAAELSASMGDLRQPRLRNDDTDKIALATAIEWPSLAEAKKLRRAQKEVNHRPRSASSVGDEGDVDTDGGVMIGRLFH